MYFHYFTINFGWKRVWPLSFVVSRKMKICKVYKYDDNNVTNNEKCLAQQTARLFFQVMIKIYMYWKCSDVF